MGPFQSAFKTQELIDLGITHILNVTCKAYTPRSKFFQYYNLQILDEKTEDAKKNFRATNRFIQEALIAAERYWSSPWKVGVVHRLLFWLT